MSMNTVANYWYEFERLVIPPAVGKEQRRDMRLAFYAGFESCMQAGLAAAVKSGDDEYAGALKMQALHDECFAFARSLDQGDFL